MARRNGVSADRAERQAALTAPERKRAAAISMRATGMGPVKRQVGGFNYTTIGDVDRFTGEKSTGRKPAGSVPAATLGVGKTSELTRTSVASPGKSVAQRAQGLAKGADAGARTVLPIDSAQAILSGKASAADWAIIAASIVPLPGKGAVRAVGKGVKAAATPRTVAFASTKPLAEGAKLSRKEIEAAIRQKLTDIQKRVDNGAAVSAADQKLLRDHGHWIAKSPEQIKIGDEKVSKLMRPDDLAPPGSRNVTIKSKELNTPGKPTPTPTRVKTPTERSKKPTEALETKFQSRVQESRAEVSPGGRNVLADARTATVETAAKKTRVKKQAAPAAESAKPMSQVEKQRARDAQKLKDQGRFDAKAPSTAQGRGKNLLAGDVEPPKSAAARKPAGGAKPKQPEASSKSGKVTASTAGKEVVVRSKGEVTKRPGAEVSPRQTGEVVKGRVIKSQELDVRKHPITMTRPGVAAKDPLAIGPGKTPKNPKKLGPRGRAAIGIGLGVGAVALGQQQLKDRGKPTPAGGTPTAAYAKKPGDVLDKFGRTITREEFNRREAFRKKYGLDKMTLAERRAWRKANPEIAKAEEAKREKFRQTEGKKRFGSAAIKKTRNVKKGVRRFDDRATKALKGSK